MAAKLLLVAASLEIDYTLISAPQTGERGTMDHKYRHLSSGLDSDSAKDIFCDPSLSLSVWSDDDLSKTISIIDPNFDILCLHLHWEYLWGLCKVPIHREEENTTFWKVFFILGITSVLDPNFCAVSL